MSGKLYVVGTPIGNLGDFSPRAVETLGAVDFIAAEDTRVTLKLLNHFGIKKEMISYFEHNKNSKGDVIVSRLLGGENCAICTDAGMPAISDPGEDLVRECIENGIDVESIPGPTAFATELARMISVKSGHRYFIMTMKIFLRRNVPSPWRISSSMRSMPTTFVTSRQVIRAATGIMTEFVRKSKKSKNCIPSNLTEASGP